MLVLSSEPVLRLNPPVYTSPSQSQQPSSSQPSQTPSKSNVTNPGSGSSQASIPNTAGKSTASK